MTTNDALIRSVLVQKVRRVYGKKTQHFKVVEEWGIQHGTARVDVAVINGLIHGYEIKSDRDTLLRLPHQIDIYNSVFDRMTLVVGKTHLFDAFHLVPGWWGVTVAKVALSSEDVVLHEIRTARKNPKKDKIAVAQLLWREEALKMLDDAGKAKGFRSKPRRVIYEKLSKEFSERNLSSKVRDALFLREEWLSGLQPA
jgi:hypothetical protein